MKSLLEIGVPSDQLASGRMWYTAQKTSGQADSSVVVVVEATVVDVVVTTADEEVVVDSTSGVVHAATTKDRIKKMALGLKPLSIEWIKRFGRSISKDFDWLWMFGTG